jgi:hypothetical protein
MQPLNDDELKGLLREWHAPPAPPTLDNRVMATAEPSQGAAWLRWLATGTIRVPVPVGIGAVVFLIFLGFQAFRPPESAQVRLQEPSQVGLAEFQPVTELKPKIIRGAYEGY